jgi:hypothetical protein
MENKNKFAKNIFTENLINNNINTKNDQKNQKIISKINKILSKDYIDLKELKNICWNGIPNEDPSLRSECWKYLLGLYPQNRKLKESNIQRKKEEYTKLCDLYSNSISNPEQLMNDSELKIYRQILKDVPRTMSEYKLFQNEELRKIFIRLLYIWSMKHPASGYVQGFNDLCVPFFIVYFLEAYKNDSISDVINSDIDKNVITDDVLFDIEVNVYNSLSKLLDRIQTHYTYNQPGIINMIKRMEKIIQVVDKSLYEYLKKMDVDFMQFCFRWMNCFLIREFPEKLMLRMWDAYFSEENGFGDFHLYVCACLLLNFSEKLKQMTEFQDLIVFLQNLPTSQWSLQDIDILLAKSYSIRELYSSIFKDKE